MPGMTAEQQYALQMQNWQQWQIYQQQYAQWQAQYGEQVKVNNIAIDWFELIKFIG